MKTIFHNALLKWIELLNFQHNKWTVNWPLSGWMDCLIFAPIICYMKSWVIRELFKKEYLAKFLEWYFLFFLFLHKTCVFIRSTHQVLLMITHNICFTEHWRIFSIPELSLLANIKENSCPVCSRLCALRPYRKSMCFLSQTVHFYNIFITLCHEQSLFFWFKSYSSWVRNIFSCY